MSCSEGTCWQPHRGLAFTDTMIGQMRRTAPKVWRKYTNHDIENKTLTSNSLVLD